VACAPLSAPAGENCQAKLISDPTNGAAFTCNVKFSNGSTMTECWTFIHANLSQDFNIYTENTEMDLDHTGCTCGATGSFKSPKFDSSPSTFECDDGSGNRLNGKLKGKNISGQSSDDNGNSAIFSCTPNTGCG
jgi:hypothetical protein